jgi:hypothetical protein
MLSSSVLMFYLVRCKFMLWKRLILELFITEEVKINMDNKKRITVYSLPT